MAFGAPNGNRKLGEICPSGVVLAGRFRLIGFTRQRAADLRELFPRAEAITRRGLARLEVKYSQCVLAISQSMSVKKQYSRTRVPGAGVLLEGKQPA